MLHDANWRDLSDLEREREYSPSSCLPDGNYRPYVEAYRRRSDEAWRKIDQTGVADTSTLRYGDGDARTIDIAVPAGANGEPPLVVYVHGGYWQELSKLDGRFAAADCVASGWAFAAIGYTLAPDAPLDAIVDDACTALEALQANASTLGFDPARIVVAGSSAGAHLAAMMALGRAHDGRPVPAVAATVLVSGIYELEPLIDTSINDALGLDQTAAQRNSPLLADLAGFPPSVIAYGDNETEAFKAQSHEFAAALGRVGARTSLIEVSGRNHFDVILDLADPATALGEAVAELVTGDGL